MGCLLTISMDGEARLLGQTELYFRLDSVEVLGHDFQPHDVACRGLLLRVSVGDPDMGVCRQG
jgi:hypothetical protein